MIYLIHKNNRVLEILDKEFKPLDYDLKNSIADALFVLAKDFPTELIIWCREELKSEINTEALQSIFHHKAILATYSVNEDNFIPNSIGYIDQSIYIKINKKVTYPTWLMNSDVGGIHSSILNKVFNTIKTDNNFDYFLNSFAKLAMPKGLFCYSEPKLLRNWQGKIDQKQASSTQLFKFIRQHYKLSWLFFMMLCLLIYNKRFPIFAFLNSIWYKKRETSFNFDQIEIQSNKKLIKKREVDVIIPTLGRKKYLFDVLKDFSNQTELPKNVIIVEQNPDSESKSELDYLFNQDWPFKIKHFFIHKLGACNARNLALKNVTSEWVILGDDDNRFESDLIAKLFESIEKYGFKSISTVYLQPEEKQTYNITGQTTIFGSGNSIIKSEMLNKISFDLAYEFGYGEDRDFGMQIRNIGEDVLFDSNIKITHLKAPIGGFRSKLNQKWDNESIQPKPSPTISLFNLKYLTKTQVLAYKLILFLNFYRLQTIKNPITYFKRFQKQWQSSLFWANQLTKDNA